MLAKRRNIRFKNGKSIETPILLPSFSSKTFQDEKLSDILAFIAGTITDEILVSAYDLHYGACSMNKLTFPSSIFLDSGGYEASEDLDLFDAGKRGHKAKSWTLKKHQDVLNKWKFDGETVIISYDAPKAKASISDQILRAERTFSKYEMCAKSILIKTSSAGERYVDISTLVQNVHRLAQFDVIGVTEKELGSSTLKRMLNISTIRSALTNAGLETPIHVFGSLDTVSTPLYFLSGADIFDGLTWLRYAFRDGSTIYKHNYGAFAVGIEIDDYRVNSKVWVDNYFYLQSLKRDMSRFLHSRDFGEFASNGDFFRKSCDELDERRRQRG